MLSIVVPVYNSVSTIEDTVFRLAAHCRERHYEWELIIIDDGSTDGTGTKLKEMFGAFPDLNVLENYVNRGKGYSLRRGFERSNGEYVIHTDADLPYSLDAIDSMLRLLQQGADVVIGSRVHRESRYCMHADHFRYIFMRHLLGRGFLITANLLLRLNVTDTQCGIKGYRRDAVRRLAPRLVADRFAFDLEMLYLARKMGLAIEEVPVTYNYKGSPSSVKLLHDGWSVMFFLIKFALSGKDGNYERKDNHA